MDDILEILDLSDIVLFSRCYWVS